MNSITTYEQGMERVGKIVPSSKLKYTWVFTIEGNNYTVNLYHSKITSKYEVRVNGKQYMVERGKSPEEFKYITRLSNKEIKIQKPGTSEAFHLFIERQDFNAMKSPEVTNTVDNSCSNSSPLESGNTTKDADANRRLTQQHKNIDVAKELANRTNRNMSLDQKTVHDNAKVMIKHPRTTDYGDINYGNGGQNVRRGPEGTLGGMKFSGMDTSDIFFNDVTVLDVKQDCNSDIIKKVNAFESK